MGLGGGLSGWAQHSTSWETESIFCDFLTYNSGTVPKDDTFTVADTTNFTATTFDITIPNIPSGTITGNVAVSLPIDLAYSLDASISKAASSLSIKPATALAAFYASNFIDKIYYC